MDGNLATQPNWQRQALCRQLAAEGLDMDSLFFPTTKRPYPGKVVSLDDQTSYRGARKVCNRCPVRVECLEWELEIESDLGGMVRAGLGMFGGKTPRERAVIIKQRMKGTA